MNFRIADTFTDSLSKLTNEEQKAVKTTAFDLQMNPANPGMQFHKLEKAKDKRFWSVRVSSDLRLIVHKTEDGLLLCYVGHHNNAYQWAESRKLETHPQTGAAQLVEIRETVKEIIIPQYKEAQKPVATIKPLLFKNCADEELLKYGVPPEWLDDVRKANEDTILELADHLPGEAAEALLCLATGTQPQIIPPAVAGSDPFKHPDAERRFRTMQNIEELERALEFPWEKWMIFLHPAQKQMVEKDYGGPTRVSGSAGTGKTIVALHRAVFLSRSNPDARVLLTTFSTTLANALRIRMRRLISNTPRVGERLECIALNEIGLRLYEAKNGRTRIASDTDVAKIMKEASADVPDHKFPLSFLITEWKDVVDAWQLNSWEEYRDAKRLGRKSRLPEKQRVILWSIFEKVRTKLQAKKLLTYAEVFTKLTAHFAKSKKLPFDYVVVDEAQDVSIAQLQFLAALGSGRKNGLFFAGDLGQRIFQQPFSWKSLGVDIRGRSRTLRINYRTSHQIRMQADRLLGKEITDVDGNVEERRGIVSVFNGPKPAIMVYDSQKKEIDAVAKWIKEQISDVMPHEIGVFVRSEAQLPRAQAAIEKSKVPFCILDDKVETESGHVSISTMHLAKGLEFRAVCVMACDDNVVPLQERIEMAGDDAELEEVYNTERHLLYVACTRARENLLITSGDSPSEFLDDLHK
ncbi:MAG: ATP-dependent DNA helicase PcrA [Deltaproteobacteria bacterium ADurb.Bin022]|jgi:mRNA-degrading endonuclease RelE of RelBE toxin-antitoxin system|nr:MAG: ATP-dependent DNA helicase PcrA [Deltaproteobacteria bacterium ADurb.Bin022]